MSENNHSASPNQTPSFGDTAALVIPAFGKSPALSLEINKTKEGERRLVEAKTVSPITYAELEYTFNEAYRELSRHSATVGYQIALAEKAIEDAKATILLDKYPTFLASLAEKKVKTVDNADLRKAYMMRDADYVAALDRLNMLKAIEAFVDGRIKVFEKVCAYMKKRMDLVIRSGLSGSELYITSGKK